MVENILSNLLHLWIHNRNNWGHIWPCCGHAYSAWHCDSLMLRTTQDNTIISPVVVTHRQGDQANVIKVSNKEGEDRSIKGTTVVSRFHLFWLTMELNKFKLIKFLSKGNYSLAHEVASNRGCDRNKPYALKKFYLRSSTAVNGAIREHRILQRLSDTATHSPFLVTLYYSFLHDESPVMDFSGGSGFDLHDLIEYFYPLSKEEAIFYCSEVISGLIAINSMEILHLDIKPENILLSNAGHAMISDFDYAYELAYNAGPPKPKDYRGTCYYMAPEIASKRCVRYVADSRGVGTVMACLLLF